MKKIYLLFLLASAMGLSKTNAQIWNNQFENWTTGTTYDSLNYWTSDNFLVPTCAQKEVSSVQSGSASLKLTTTSYSGLSLPGAISTGGFLLNGFTINLATGGQPDNIRHVLLKGYYKYTSVLGAQGSIETVLYHYNGTTRDTIASGILAVTASANYTFFSVPLAYKSVIAPDTSIVFFQSSGRNTADLLNPATLGSTLYIDSVYFDRVTGVDDLNQDLVSVISYPNPAIDFLVIESTWKTPVAGSIAIVDVLGKLIETIPILHEKQQVDVHSLSNGNYFYYLLDEHGKKLNSGKFSVNR